MKHFLLNIFLLVAINPLFAQLEKTKIVAHRGYHTVAESAENSMTALIKAQEIGIYGSELDVWVTTDGIVVLNHDETINGKIIQNLTYSEIKDCTLSNGEKIPTLEAYMEQALKVPALKLIIEIKTHNSTEKNNRAADAVWALVQEKNMEELVEYIAFDYGICKRLAEKDTRNIVGYLNGDKAPQTVFNDGIKSIDYHMSVYQKNTSWIKQAQDLGMIVNVWTVNKDTDMEYFVKAGVDMITTDYPDRLKTMLNIKKVACVGNSITQGVGASTSSAYYPTFLQEYLGKEAYLVQNYGVGGSTMLKKGHKPYWNESKYAEVLAWNPDIVVIKLGTNDALSFNLTHISELKENYIEFINSFKALSSNPEIYICYPIPLFGPNNGINTDNVMKNRIIPVIKEVAEETGVSLIDMHSPFEGKSYLVPDKVHPNDKGYALLANVVANAICPKCDIPKVADNILTLITPFSKIDNRIQITSSVNNVDLNYLTDKNLETISELNFEKDMWIQVEMPASCKITAYSISFGQSDITNAPKSWKFQASNNGTNWTTLDERNNIQFSANETMLMNDYITSYNALRDYKYFRILFSENQGGDKLSIAEYQLYGSDMNFENSIMNNGGTISSQSKAENGSPLEYLVDKKASTCFSTSNRSLDIIYESSSDVIINKYTLTSASNLSYAPVVCMLYASTDGTSYRRIDIQKELCFASTYSTLEFPISDTRPYKYFKLSISKVGGSEHKFQLAEWQIFEEKSNKISGVAADDFNIFTESGKLVVVSRSNENASLNIFSITGRCFYTRDIASQETISYPLERGVYLVAINTSQGKFLVKTTV